MPAHLSDGDRWKIVYLFNDLHLSFRQIAKRVKCTDKTAARVIQKYRETGAVSDRHHTGRPSIMNQQSLRRLDRIISKHTSYTSTALADEMMSSTGVRISPRTIRRARTTALSRHPVHERVVKALKPRDITRRLAFANAHVNDDFHHVVFSDEKLFVLSKTGTVHYIKKGEPIPTREVDDPKASLMIWGGVWWSNKTSLHTCSKTINAPYYTNILATHLLPSMPTSSRYLFQHDNATPHIARHTQAWLAAFAVNVLPNWPPNSPELNPIEHVWSWMAAYVNNKRPRNRTEMKRYIRLAWQQIPQKVIQAYISNLPALMQRVISANGDSI